MTGTSCMHGDLPMGVSVWITSQINITIYVYGKIELWFYQSRQMGYSCPAKCANALKVTAVQQNVLKH